MSDTLTKVDFTIDDVAAKIREVAAENPDHIYEGHPNAHGGTTCLYREGEDRNEPGCIVGQALDRLGYVVPEGLEGSHAQEVMASLGFDAYAVHGMAISHEAKVARWIRYVQGRQDEKCPWGQAVADADEPE